MPNPIMNDKALEDAAAKEGWAAPTGLPAGAGALAPPVPSPLDAGQGPWGPPVTDGPISTWHGRVMTVNGTISATGVLMVLLLASAVVGWNSVEESIDGSVQFPPISMIGVIVGFVAVIVASFKPNLAKFLGPVYALAQGFFVGAISKAYESFQDGIVIQAIGATLGVFAVMLFLYHTRILKVTDRMRRTVIAATFGLMIFYLVSFVISLFAGSGGVSFINSPSALGILFSVFAAGLAAFNLALDFDFIERGAQRGLPKNMEWFAALGLVVTLVWLYLEMLRLLSKLNRN
jgi:uncharacterized YccA/Bax inhibitor family protein